MGIPEELRERIGEWDNLSRWERSEIGRDLRRLGLSYGEIMTVIDVKKSTLATWCRKIELSRDQRDSILARTGSRAGIPVDTQWRRRLEVEGIQAAAKEEIGPLIQQPLWIAGVVLYWAEGNKTGSSLGLANSDPRALNLFIAWCRTFHHEEAEFVLKLNLHAANDEQAARQWWESVTDLRPAKFHKTFIKPDGTGHRKNHLSYGVCMARMSKSADAFHRTLAWIEGIGDYFQIKGDESYNVVGPLAQLAAAGAS